MRYVALLRAVNVGGRTVKMDALRAALTQIPLDKVETFIASGNAIFESRAGAAALERKIETQLEKTFGFAVPTLIRTTAEIGMLATYEPFPKLPASKKAHATYVGFLKEDPTEDGIAKIMKLGGSANQFRFHDRQLFWRVLDREEFFRLPATTFERALGMPTTFRNVTTVRRLAEKYPG